jgi:hypothetical protein
VEQLLLDGQQLPPAAFLHPFRCGDRLGDCFLAAHREQILASTWNASKTLIRARLSNEGKEKENVPPDQKQTMRRSLCDGGRRQASTPTIDG